MLFFYFKLKFLVLQQILFCCSACHRWLSIISRSAAGCASVEYMLSGCSLFLYLNRLCFRDLSLRFTSVEMTICIGVGVLEGYCGAAAITL